MLRLALGIGTEDNLFSQMRCISTLSKAAGGRGFMDEKATPEDVATWVRTRRGLIRLDVLGSLSNKLNFEAERRRLYSGI